MSVDSPSREPAPRVPSYRRHRPSGQAVVTLDGHDIYSGKYGSKASRSEYDRLIGEWLAAGRCLPRPDADLTIAELAIAELALAYWRHAKGYYRGPDGRPTGSLDRVKIAVRILRESYAHKSAKDFGPLAFQAVQNELAASGRSRRYCNYLTETIKRVFKWAVSQELLPEAVYRTLTTVPGLKIGRTEARESEPVGPVADEVIDATLPHLPAPVAAMVMLDRWTGCRPEEVCRLRPIDVDRSGPVWRYTPQGHKTAYCGKQRKIFIGPKAQDELIPHWAPSQLRHTAATEIRKAYGLESVQAVLGHAHMKVSEIYAEKNLSPAAEPLLRAGTAGTGHLLFALPRSSLITPLPLFHPFLAARQPPGTPFPAIPPRAAFHLPQRQRPAVRGDRPPVELGHHLTPPPRLGTPAGFRYTLSS